MAASSSCTAASTARSAVGNPNNKIYHVFLNHRGDDVKKTLGRSLYLRLLENGLTAFLDNEEIKAGYEISSQLEHAVRTASVHVAILSPRYAESHWCLDELLLMLETKAPIIPVFYHVTPSDVRWALGQYGQDLKTHEEKGRHNSNTITRWRKALQVVANYSGFQMEMCNGEELELELVNKVVKSVLEIVKKPDLYVAQHPTGLDDKVKDFEDRIQLQQQQSGKPQKKLWKDLEQVEKPIDTIDEVMQDLSRIKPQMVQKVLSSIEFSDKNADFTDVNRQGEGFNRRSEASSHAEMLELFPVSAVSGFGSNPRVTENKITLPSAIGHTDLDSRSVPAKASEEQSTTQLTIVCKGAMNIYDVPAEKVQAIMNLATASSLGNTSTFTNTTSEIEQRSKSLPSKPLANSINENQPHRPPAGLEIVRKLSLQRFIQKRHEKLNSVAPYTTMKPATLPSKAEKD